MGVIQVGPWHHLFHTHEHPLGACGPKKLRAGALALAWRIGLELIVAILVATGLGWAFDRWLGTRPWGMIVMFFLGIAAGMVNVWRAVTGMGMAVGYGKASAAVKDEEEDED